MVSLTAFVYAAAHPGPPETLEVKPTHAYSTLCDLKCVLRGGNQRPQQPLLSSDRIRRMCKKAEQAIYATAYADGEPVACRVGERCLERLRACIPARKTHTAVGAPSTPLRVQARDDNVQHMLGQMIMRQMTQLEAGLPGLTIFGSGKSNIPSPSRPQQTPPMLALTDGSADIHASAVDATGGSVDMAAIDPNTTEAGADITAGK